MKKNKDISINEINKIIEKGRHIVRNIESEIINMEIDFDRLPEQLKYLSNSVFNNFADSILFNAMPLKNENAYEFLTIYDSAILSQPKAFLIAKYYFKERCRRINEKFILNTATEKQILRINQMFIKEYNKAVKEASSVIDEIKIKSIKNYTVEIKLTPYIKIFNNETGSYEKPKTGFYHDFLKYLPKFTYEVIKVNGCVEKVLASPYEKIPNFPETFIAENKICDELIELANGVWAWDDCFKIKGIEKEIIIKYGFK